MVAAAVVGAAVVGAAATTVASNKAAGASSAAANSSIGEQQREYNQSRADQAPFRTTGVSALDQISKLYGLDTTDSQGNVVKGTGKADFSSFTQSPDFQFNLNQGQDAINRSAASKGGLLSGAAVKEGQQYASGLADQQFGSYYNRLAGIAGIGQTSTNTTDQLGANAANNISNAYTNAGNARASAYDQNGQSIANTTNSLANNYLYSYYRSGQGKGS